MSQAEFTASEAPTMTHLCGYNFFLKSGCPQSLLNFKMCLHIFLTLLSLKEMDVASRDERCTSG